MTRRARDATIPWSFPRSEVKLAGRCVAAAALPLAGQGPMRHRTEQDETQQAGRFQESLRRGARYSTTKAAGHGPKSE